MARSKRQKLLDDIEQVILSARSQELQFVAQLLTMAFIEAIEDEPDDRRPKKPVSH